MSPHYKILDWDSQFFKIQVAKVNNNVFKHDCPQQILQEMLKEGIDLGYYYSDEQLPVDFPMEHYESILVDKKIPLRKELKVSSRNHPNIAFFDADKPTPELVELAQLAGIHTRFKVDPYISEETYKDLFRIWIERSVDGSIASRVLVYRKDEKIVGFGTVKINGEEGQAPLFAVKRDYEGKGISFALMEALESYMAEQGCKYVLTSTQETNKKALKIYQRYGLQSQKRIYVYHFWRKT